MSGSGPTPTGPGGRDNGGDNGVDCTNIFERTTLASPNPEVLETLQAGEILNLNLQPPGGPVYAVTEGGETAGSITSASLLKIIRCIREGYSYVAIILEIDGGKCDVEIRHA